VHGRGYLEVHFMTETKKEYLRCMRLVRIGCLEHLCKVKGSLLC